MPFFRVPFESVRSHVFVNAGKITALTGTETFRECSERLLRAPSILSAGIGVCASLGAARVELNLVQPLLAHRRQLLSIGTYPRVQIGIGMQFL